MTDSYEDIRNALQTITAGRDYATAAELEQFLPPDVVAFVTSHAARSANGDGYDCRSLLSLAFDTTAAQ